MASVVYIETGIASYLTATPNRDLIMAGDSDSAALTRSLGFEMPAICTPLELIGE